MERDYFRDGKTYRKLIKKVSIGIGEISVLIFLWRKIIFLNKSVFIYYKVF
jgi:hypothetical protein